MSNETLFWIGVHAGSLVPPEAIACRMGLPLPNVIEALQGYDVTVPPGHEVVTLALPAKHRTLIAAEALRRGLEMPPLASLVLATVARDDLFDAVL